MITDYAKPLAGLISRLEAFPGIGEKSATRIAYYILKLPKEEAEELAASILTVKNEVRECSVCFNLSDEDVCPVCSDTARNRELLCVVADPRDLVTVERTREYNGLYHILGGVINPAENVGPGDLHIRELVERVAAGGFREVIIALNPTVEGDTTAIYISRLIREFGVEVTRIGSGMPVGGEIDYADQATVIRALVSRRPI